MKSKKDVLSQHYFAFLISVIAVIYRIHVTHYFTPTSDFCLLHIYFFYMIVLKYKTKLEFAKRLTFCVVCCCITYRTAKRF